MRSLPATGKVWAAWSVPACAGMSICCYNDSRGWKTKSCCNGCSLARSSGGWSMTDDVRGSGAIKIVVRLEEGLLIATLERLSGEGNREDVREHALFWIGQRGGERGFRFLRDFMRGDASTNLKKRAIFSISQSSSDNAVPELINIARRDASTTLRRDALFWLGQKAGEKAAGELRRAVDDDPDEDVREHAVFAISQLPRERSVPLLIDLARTHKSKRVREKALFWLAQTGDPRAIDVIEEILMK